MDKGFVIAFEGGEGSGKSTALPIFKQLLEEKGFKVKTYAEPGGTKYAKEVRRMFFNYRCMGVKAAVHLMNSQRQDNIDTLIKPYIDKGYIVLIDRFVTSTMVYQGMLSDKLGDLKDKDEQFEWVEDHVVTHDHVVFFFDCPPEVSTKRLAHRDNNNHFDELSLEKHTVIYDGYKMVLEGVMNNGSFKEFDIGKIVAELSEAPYVPGCVGVNTIDARDSIEGVTEQLRESVEELAEVFPWKNLRRPFSNQ